MWYKFWLWVGPTWRYRLAVTGVLVGWMTATIAWILILGINIIMWYSIISGTIGLIKLSNGW